VIKSESTIIDHWEAGNWLEANKIDGTTHHMVKQETDWKQIIYSKEGKASTSDAQLKIHFEMFFIM